MTGQLELTRVTFKKDALIGVEGQPRVDRFFIIRQGQVRIFKEMDMAVDEGGALRGPGDFFGVVSAMSSQSHIETVQALTEVNLISVRRDQYGAFIQQHPSVAMKIILDFSRRLRILDGALSRFTLKKTAEEAPAHLFQVGDYYARQGRYPQACYAYRRYLEQCPEGEFSVQARERLEKIAPRAGTVVMHHDPREFSRIYPKNSMFFAEGEPGEELYTIQKGAVTISKIVDNQEVLIAVLRGGDIFGEMAMLEQKPRTASAVAHEDCMVTVINQTNFGRMIQEYPQIVARLTTLQAERIWFVYKQLANATMKDPLGRMYDALTIHLERSRVAPKSTESFLFSFGPAELVSFVGLSAAEGGPVIRQLLESKRISLVKNRLFAMNVLEIRRETSMFRIREKLERARQ
jgi:CRP-like cAMP-binding protein